MADLDETPVRAGNAGVRWTGEQQWPTAKQRTGVQHAVNKLLDALAPERAPARVGAPEPAVQRIRSPRGCILQGPTQALSISWFPATNTEASLGELQVMGWRGVVSRPGSARRGSSAEALWRTELHPVEVSPEVWGWRAGDGTVIATETLVARCEALTPPSEQLLPAERLAG
jgi:hypothetical protein